MLLLLRRSEPENGNFNSHYLLLFLLIIIIIIIGGGGCRKIFFWDLSRLKMLETDFFFAVKEMRDLRPNAHLSSVFFSSIVAYH